MSRDVLQSTKDRLEEDVIYPFFAVELLFDDSPLRLWNGVGTLVYEGDSYTGTGNLLNISDIEETSELSVEGATLTLSGIPSEVISLALSEPYQGRLCKIYFGTFAVGALQKEDGDYIQQENGDRILLQKEDTNLTEIFAGYMDQMNIEESASSCVIQLKVENKLIDLERPRVRRYTASYQQSVYPNDKGFNFVNDLQDKEVLWGRK
jgi:hypothetical protein